MTGVQTCALPISKGVHKKSTDNSEFVNISSFEYTKFKESLKLTIDWFQDCKKSHPEKLRLYPKTQNEI